MRNVFLGFTFAVGLFALGFGAYVGAILLAVAGLSLSASAVASYFGDRRFSIMLSSIAFVLTLVSMLT